MLNLDMKKMFTVCLLGIGCCFAGTGEKIVEAARAQVGVTVGYDPAYVSLEYPDGDVPKESGVCTDVIVRALRKAMGKDLQKLVHEDMRSAFSEYPKIWGLKRPDRNIDHRRVPNLKTFFVRKHKSIPLGGRISVPEILLPARFLLIWRIS